jgi:hypothetical protein
MLFLLIAATVCPGTKDRVKGVALAGRDRDEAVTNCAAGHRHPGSSGCIRLTNQNVSDLYPRVSIGTTVIVLPMDRRADNAGGKRG